MPSFVRQPTASMASEHLSSEQLARIQLLRTPNVGPISFFQLLARFGSAVAALEALPDLIRSAGRKSVKIASMQAVQDEVRQISRSGAQYLFHDDADYPEWLSHIENAPPILMIKGHRELLVRPAVAIVGARNASAASNRFARILAAELAEAGFLVVSGLARGIDTAAHQGVMAASSDIAATAGVIASGIDIAYPPENGRLQAEMAERALVIAEQPPGSEPLARNFPYRNRIIAGMAIGTLVVEAAPRSGSLITARLASEMGREVMAVPGSPADSRSRGCNELIRNGAVLVQNVDDIIELLSPIGEAGAALAVSRKPVLSARIPQANGHRPPAPLQIAGDHASIVAFLGAAPLSVDELIRQSGMAAGDVQTALLDLELAGRLERHAGGRVSLVTG